MKELWLYLNSQIGGWGFVSHKKANLCSFFLSSFFILTLPLHLPFVSPIPIEEILLQELQVHIGHQTLAQANSNSKPASFSSKPHLLKPA